LTTGDWAVAEDTEATVLARIDEPGVGLALWRRSQPGDLARWLASTSAGRLPRGRMLVRSRDIAWAFAEMARPEAHALAIDMADLTERFCAIAATPQVDIRVETLSHDGCWKFHYDNVALRLITTYRGPGTQWVAAADGARALTEQRAYAGPVREIPCYAVGLFKGTATGSARAVVHRSPPIAGTGTTRLVLVLNLPSAASPPLARPEELTTGD
jgi:hypothetical protein